MTKMWWNMTDKEKIDYLQKRLDESHQDFSHEVSINRLQAGELTNLNKAVTRLSKRCKALKAELKKYKHCRCANATPFIGEPNDDVSETPEETKEKFSE